VAKLSHVDDNNRPAMVDVGGKAVTAREAHARTVVVLPDAVLAALDGDEIRSKKGPVFATAIIAGVMAAKKTHELDGNRAVIDCRCKVTHKTGVEMEALTGASVAALTVYDMCKALSHDIVISETRLMMKTGGKQDFHRAGDNP
jgi:cyclic pyranopterin phosphate synthase